MPDLQFQISKPENERFWNLKLKVNTSKKTLMRQASILRITQFQIIYLSQHWFTRTEN